MKNKQKGITLIALVITIVVLLILSGITIGTLTGENGIITSSKEAKEQTEIANEKEIIEVAWVDATQKDKYGEVTKEKMDNALNKILGEDKHYSDTVDEGIVVTFKSSKRSYLVDGSGNVGEYIVKEPVEQPEPGGENFNMTVGTMEVVFLTGTSYNVGKANAPEIDGTMIPIKYNGENWVVTTTSDPDWYNYNIEEKKWANVMLSDGTYKAGSVKAGQVIQENELGSMFVWIPRYAYKIVYFNSEEDKQAYLLDRNDVSRIVGYSDARGIVDTQGKVPSDINQKQDTSIAVEDNYRTHPVFEKDVDKGGWGKKTKGIWVGKFEMTTTTSSNGTNMILPNKQARRNENITKFFTDSQAIGEKFNMALDSHLIKNSEWGAVAYLAESKYGRNGEEISVNQCSNYCTGVGRGLNKDEDSTKTGDGKIYNSTYSWSSVKDIQKYNGSVGVLSSTTGNIYGIYDMAGGSWEYMMAFYKDENGNIHTGYNTNYHSNFNGYLYNGTEYKDGVDLPEKKYYQVYEDNIYTTMGDALFETSAWNQDRNQIAYAYRPIHTRSGMNNDTYAAGLFYYDMYDGRGHGNAGCRVCLTAK